MNKRQYHKEMESMIAGLGGERKRLLLHCCCAPCSSYVLLYLREYFDITCFYYNPNITIEEEYKKRFRELVGMVDKMNMEAPAYPIRIMEGPYEPDIFLKMSAGKEELPEGGERCFGCYALRLKKTAEAAKEGGFDFFTTSLTISPLKNAEKLNTIGEKLSRCCGVSFLNSDFKKKDGYKESIRLSAEYDLYRQDYCGCVFSKKQREKTAETEEGE